MNINHAIQNTLVVFFITAVSTTAQNIVTNGSFEQVQIGHLTNLTTLPMFRAGLTQAVERGRCGVLDSLIAVAPLRSQEMVFNLSLWVEDSVVLAPQVGIKS